MKRLEDFEDSPLVPALLMKLHEDADKVLMNASRFCRSVKETSETHVHYSTNWHLYTKNA